MRRTFIASLMAASLLLILNESVSGQALTTAFTFQGEARFNGALASGLHDLRFRLYDAVGTPIGTAQCMNNVQVTNGRFAVPLDFGAQFAGAQRFVEIDVRADSGLDCTNSTGFTTLAPRQELTAAPYALYAPNAGSATNATNLNNQLPSFYTNATNLSAGTLPSARLIGTYSSALTLSSSSNVFFGSGLNLTNLNATNLASGTVADARLSTNIPRLNAAQTFSANNTFSGNVGIGGAPGTDRLDITGIARVSQGVRFGDNSLQTTAALVNGRTGVLSGISGSSISLSINSVNVPNATLASTCIIVQPYDIASGLATGSRRCPAGVIVRRPRTGDQTWYDAVRNNASQINVVLTLTLPNTSSIAWSFGTCAPFAYRLRVADDGSAVEEMSLGVDGTSRPTRAVVGTLPAATAPTYGLFNGIASGLPAGSRLVPRVNGVLEPNVIAVADTAYARPIDSLGIPTGSLRGSVSRVRQNPTGLTFPNWWSSGGGRTFDFWMDLGTGTDFVATNSGAVILTSYSIRPSDDGSIVEEYEVFMQNP
jgi:hypothetical protein